jgi:hypothetical protein
MEDAAETGEEEDNARESHTETSLRIRENLVLNQNLCVD